MAAATPPETPRPTALPRAIPRASPLPAATPKETIPIPTTPIVPPIAAYKFYS